MKKLYSIIVLILLLGASQLLPTAVLAAERFENVQLFGTLPSHDKGRQLGDCFAGLTDFLYTTIGNGFTAMGSDFYDYWADFFFAPAHFNDVYALQLQLNKTRSAVIGTFLRCDVSRFDQVTSQYYNLEEELYFVRHFIDTSSLVGTPSYDDQITNDARRRAFKELVVANILQKSPKTDEDKKRALYEGNFDYFVAKYTHKVEQYRLLGYADDPDTQALKEKIKKLGDTISSFKTLGSELEALGSDVGETVEAAGKVVGIDDNPESSGLYGLITGIASRFDICAETNDDRYCASDAIKYLNSHDVVKESADARARNRFKTSSSEPKSFGDVMFSIEQEAENSSNNLNEAEMLARYELLYGHIAGSGIRGMIDKVDHLNNTIKKGSIKPLENIEQCADFIEDKQCP